MNLQETLIEYLESKGWYFDMDWVKNEIDVGYPAEDDDGNSITLPSERPDVLHRYAAWTVPQWGAYWKSGDRRYEKFEQAIVFQLLREEDPEQFAGFFRDKTETK